MCTFLVAAGVECFPTVAGLHAARSAGEGVRRLYEQVSRIGVKKLHRYVDAGFEEDDLLANREALLEYSLIYQRGDADA